MLINKEKLINKIATEVHYDTEHPLESYAKLLMMIVEAEEDDRRGHWIVAYNDNEPFSARCSNCGYAMPISTLLFMRKECPACGSQMEEAEE